MQEMQVRIEAHDFRPHDFVGGNVALDFANTITSWGQAPRDWIDGYDRLVDWALDVGLVDAGQARELAAAAAAQPDAAAAALGRAKALRTVLHHLFAALAAGTAPTPDLVAALEGHWRRAVAAHGLTAAEGRLVLAPHAGPDLDLIAHLVARAAVDLAADFPAERLRLCEGDHCGWLFIDVSKGGRRRWCDMATCGNVAKSRRHQKRLKQP